MQFALLDNAALGEEVHGKKAQKGAALAEHLEPWSLLTHSLLFSGSHRWQSEWSEFVIYWAMSGVNGAHTQNKVSLPASWHSPHLLSPSETTRKVCSYWLQGGRYIAFRPGGTGPP